MSDMKRCAACGIDKSLGAFVKNRSRPNGVGSYCKECKKAKDTLWYERNREARIDAAAAWALNNREASNTSKRKWSLKNSDAHKLARENWKKNNPDRVNQILQRYRAKKIDATVGWVPTLSEMVDFYGCLCMYPGCPRSDIEMDHIIPLSMNGAHSANNLQLLCRTHNASKGNREAIDYRPFPMDVIAYV